MTTDKPAHAGSHAVSLNDEEQVRQVHRFVLSSDASSSRPAVIAVTCPP